MSSNSESVPTGYASGRMSDPIGAGTYQAGSSPLLVSMTTKTRTALGYTAVLLALASALVLAYGMHQRANAAPVQPTWQQAVVTVDDERAATLAREWGAPFEVRYAADADITVGKEAHEGTRGGEATRTMDGDRITGCRITVEAASDVVMLHELGHCFGLHHDNGHSDSLMYWIQGGDSGAAGVTDVDRAALADLYAS